MGSKDVSKHSINHITLLFRRLVSSMFLNEKRVLIAGSFCKTIFHTHLLRQHLAYDMGPNTPELWMITFWKKPKQVEILQKS